MKRSSPHSQSIQDQAAAWLVRRQAGLTPAEEEALRLWRDADPQHATALADIESAWSVVTVPARIGQAHTALEVLRTRHLRRMRRRKQVLASVGGAATAMLLLLIAPRVENTTTSATAPAFVIRPDKQVLPDGSTVELNAGSDIETLYSADRRLVRLVRGEALFTVTKDPARPFVVSAGGVEVRAVGTAFSVRLKTKEVDVLVTHGQVAVERGDGQPVLAGPENVAGATLYAGQLMQVPLEQTGTGQLPVVQVAAMQIDSALAWRGKRIEFTNTSLADVVDLFNRENHVHIGVPAARAAKIRISGIFWVDDPEGFVRLIEKGFNLEARREGDTIRLR